MKLLVVTQAVDKRDPVLGFFHTWLEALAKECASIEVVCLFEGAHALPSNVRVHSLGKERGERSPFVYAVRFKWLAWNLRHDYDAVFVHMNPEYLIIAGPMWRFLGKRSVLWYMHKTVSWRLRLGVFFANAVVTASPMSMRVATEKKKVLGHGIDLEEIRSVIAPGTDEPLQLISIGRLSPVKRIEVLIGAVAILKDRGVEATLTLAGGAAGKEGAEYARALRARAESLGVTDSVQFLGPVPHERVSELLRDAHLFLHASATGSLDKASLEPLATGVPVITADKELAEAGIEAIRYAQPSAEAFAKAIEEARKARLWSDETVRARARAYVAEHHDLQKLIPRILALLQSETADPRAFYNTVMPGKIGNDYESARWKSSPLQKAQYAMTEQIVREQVIPLLPTNGKLLEVGPGPGTWTKVVRDARPSLAFTLLDISSEMLARAKAALGSDGAISYIESDLVDFSSNEQFDGFFSSRALEYMPDKQAAAKKIAALLKSGGKGGLITKMPKPLFDRLRGRSQGFHQRQVTPGALTRHFEAAGLRVRTTRPATATVPLLNSAPLNRAIFALTKHLPAIFPFTIFAESYCITFEKP